MLAKAVAELKKWPWPETKGIEGAGKPSSTRSVDEVGAELRKLAAGGQLIWD